MEINKNYVDGGKFQPDKYQKYVADGRLGTRLGMYQDFLTLWNDADPDIPILIAAKSEYAKLK